MLKIDEEARQKQAASSAGAAVQESSDAPEPPDCIDAEVINWLRTHRSATATEFETFLRSVYNRPDMRVRFPHGI